MLELSLVPVPLLNKCGSHDGVEMVADRAACHNRKDKPNDVRSDGYHEYDAAHTMIVGTDQAAFARGEATGVLFEAS